MKKFFLWTALSLILICILSACSSGSDSKSGGTSENTDDKVYTLKGGHVLAANHPYHLGFLKLKELLEERTKGRIKLDAFPSSQLGNERDLIEGVQMGTVDLCLTATSPIVNFDTNFLIFDLPNLFEDREHVYKVLDGEIGEEILKGLEKISIKGLAYWETGFFNVFDNERPLNTPEDLKGLTIRVMENPLYISYFAKLGANPVPMAYGEVFTALQNKTINGTLIPIASIYTSKFHTVAPYVSRTQNFYGPTPLLMNKKKYDSLPADLQKILLESAAEARDYMRDLLKKGEDEQIELMKKEGATVLEVDKKKWADAPAVKAVYDEFVPSKINPDLVKRIKDMH